MIDLNALPNRKDNEQITYLLRRHWIVPFTIFGTLIIGAAIPTGAYLIIRSQFSELLHNPVMTPILALFACFFVLAVWLFVIQEFVDYYLDMWIVTNERVIDISQQGLFKRTSAELHLSSIVDVTSEVKGMVPTFLNYGDLIIQTPGETARFHFQQIPHPEEVRQTILKLVDEDRVRHGR